MKKNVSDRSLINRTCIHMHPLNHIEQPNTCFYYLLKTGTFVHSKANHTLNIMLFYADHFRDIVNSYLL